MNDDMKEFALIFSIIVQENGNVLVECEEVVIKAQRVMSAMALHRIQLAEIGFDNKYIVVYHDAGEVS